MQVPQCAGKGGKHAACLDNPSGEGSLRGQHWCVLLIAAMVVDMRSIRIVSGDINQGQVLGFWGESFFLGG